MQTKTLSLLILLPAFGCASRIERVIGRVEPAIVKIGVVSDKGQGVCSGAIIRRDGLVLTCAHCFAHPGIQKVFIKTADGMAYLAGLVKIDPDKDLALIEPLNNKTKRFSFLEVGAGPKQGQQVLSFGSPLGLQHSVTVGYIVNFAPKKYIFHSAFITPGNSGGPLVDLKGRLVGINEAMVIYGFMEKAHGLYMAVDLPTICKFLEE